MPGWAGGRALRALHESIASLVDVITHRYTQSFDFKLNSFSQVPCGGSIVVPGNAYFQASSGFDFGPPVAGATISCGYSDGSRPDTKSHYSYLRLAPPTCPRVSGK